MELSKQIEKAKIFRELHNGRLFLLPNAWNGGSAKVFEKSGFSAIGTTSAGIAYSLGYEDGEKIQFRDIIRVVREILNITELPLTVDIERGYGESLKEIEGNVEKVITAGAVGINIEDGIPQSNSVEETSDFIEKINMLCRLREKMEIPFFINARTDIYLLNTGDKDEMFNRTVERANELEKAGADCVFIPGALDEETISKLRAEIHMPINLFLHSEFCDKNKLEEIGINRLSSGSGIVRTSLNNVIGTSNEFYNGRFQSMISHQISYGDANDFFRRRSDDRENHI